MRKDAITTAHFSQPEAPVRRAAVRTLWRGLSLVPILLCLAYEAGAQTFTEFPLPNSYSRPWAIVAGPDAALWFTEAGDSTIANTGKKIGRITLAGAITEYPTQGQPGDIALGPDGNLWFAEYFPDASRRIARITPGGVISEFPLPNAISFVGRIVTGPDGAIWFSESRGIGRITTDGLFSELDLPQLANGTGQIAFGANGLLWFTAGHTIGFIATDGTVTEFPTGVLPFPIGAVSPTAIAVGRDGALWFTEDSSPYIGRATTDGKVTNYPAHAAFAFHIVSGPDGNLWFTNTGYNFRVVVPGAISRIALDGTVTEFSLPDSNSAPLGITVGPDGNIWFTEYGADRIAKLENVGFPSRRPRQVPFH